MKKQLLLTLTFFAVIGLNAQWVNDPVNNTLIANTSYDAGEIYLATNPVSGDTYVHWMQFAANGWSPNVQRISPDGTPLWGDNGIHIGGPTLSSSSEGVAMATTTDGGVVTCFATETDTRAVKLNADGSFAWGEQGLQLFGGQGYSRTELLAGNDGGVWALGSDYDNTYLCYINADGTLNPTITLSDAGGRDIAFSQMLPNADNAVFVIYESNHWAYTYYYEKEIWVVGYTRAGNQIAPPVRLMAPQTMGGSYAHFVVPDGQGGGYAYIWHSAISGSFNTYVFHFDANGASTIDNINGVPVHSEDPANFFLDAYATVDPVSHDLLIAYQQTDASTQSQCRLYVNRITPTGEKLWGDGKVLFDSGTNPCTDLLIDAFEDGSGFSLIFNQGGYYGTIEAMGFDIYGTPLWSTQLSSTSYPKTICRNSTGFYAGQNIVTWIDATNQGLGGMYGQNLQPNGQMGPLPQGCIGPENFQGEYVYDSETTDFGVRLTWDEPNDPVEIYRLTRKNRATGEEVVIEFGGENAFYFDASGIGRFRYQLQALYADLDCGFSQPATTPTGEDYVSVTVTETMEQHEDPVVKVLNIYTLSGQLLLETDPEQLSQGVYILQGLTESGQRVHRKFTVIR